MQSVLARRTFNYQLCLENVESAAGPLEVADMFGVHKVRLISGRFVGVMSVVCCGVGLWIGLCAQGDGHVTGPPD